MEYAPVMDMLESMGIPMLDGILAMPLEHDQDHIGAAKKILGELPIGITHFLFHPSVDTPELRVAGPRLAGAGRQLQCLHERRAEEVPGE